MNPRLDGLRATKLACAGSEVVSSNDFSRSGMKPLGIGRQGMYTPVTSHTRYQPQPVRWRYFPCCEAKRSRAAKASTAEGH